MAMASVSWDSVEIEPRLMAPVQKRLTISLAGSTSSIGMGPSLTLDLKVSKPRNVQRLLASALASLANCSYAVRLLKARCGLNIRDRLWAPHMPLAFSTPMEFAWIR